MAQYIPLEAGKRFQMGKGDSRHLVSPENGASRLTMNYSIFQAGQEFPQHMHDISADVFIVLEGGVSVRQGDSYVPIHTGDFAYIPSGEVHGTVNQTDEQAILISFQSPPDPSLYSGERDPSVTGVVPRPPENHVTTVQIRALKSGKQESTGKGGKWTPLTRADGAKEMTIWYVELAPGEKLDAAAVADTETVWFVWEGKADIRVNGDEFAVGRRGVVLLEAGEPQHITNNSDAVVQLIRCQAPA